MSSSKSQRTQPLTQLRQNPVNNIPGMLGIFNQLSHDMWDEICMYLGSNLRVILMIYDVLRRKKTTNKKNKIYWTWTFHLNNMLTTRNIWSIIEYCVPLSRRRKTKNGYQVNEFMSILNFLFFDETLRNELEPSNKNPIHNAIKNLNISSELLVYIKDICGKYNGDFPCFSVEQLEHFEDKF